MIFAIVYLLIGGVLASIELIENEFIEDGSVSFAEKVLTLMIMLIFWLPSLIVELIISITHFIEKKKNKE